MISLTKYEKGLGAYSVSCGLITSATSWLTHSITKVGIMHGFGFGAVVGPISLLSFLIINEKLKNEALSLGLSTTIGCAAGFAVSTATATLGFTAAPITISGAALCTGVLVTINVALFFFVIRVAKYCEEYIKNDEETKKQIREGDLRDIAARNAIQHPNQII